MESRRRERHPGSVRNRIVTGALLLVFSNVPAAWASTGLAGERDPSAISFAQRLSVVQAQREDIESEIQRRQGHDWAGDYRMGDGLGFNVRYSLAPDAGAAAIWQGCMGVYGADSGAVSALPDGRLQLAFEQNGRSLLGGFADQLVPVRWGERRYLIAPSQMMDFVNAVNLGQEPRLSMLGNFLLAEGDETRPVFGLPELPQGMSSLVRTQPALMMLRSATLMGEDRNGLGAREHYRLSLDRSDFSPVAVGQSLKLLPDSVDTDRVYARATVTRVSGAKVQVDLELQQLDPHAAPVRPDGGWMFTTGAFDSVEWMAKLDSLDIERTAQHADRLARGGNEVVVVVSLD